MATQAPREVRSLHFLNLLLIALILLLQSFYQREKDHYDLGVIERICTPVELVRVRLKSKAKGPSKFQCE